MSGCEARFLRLDKIELTSHERDNFTKTGRFLSYVFPKPNAIPDGMVRELVVNQ